MDEMDETHDHRGPQSPGEKRVALPLPDPQGFLPSAPASDGSPPRQKMKSGAMTPRTPKLPHTPRPNRTIGRVPGTAARVMSQDFSTSLTIGGQIGSGEFSVVHSAFSASDKQLYALKIVSGRGYRDSLSQTPYETLQTQIPRHENIVAVHKTWVENGRLHILSELCDCNLHQYVVSHPNLDEATFLSFALDMLSGLDHIHRNGFMHLDIKPENMLVHNLRVKISDFGHARRISDARQATEGDSTYMAPEELKEVYSPAADIYSLGLSLLEITTNMVLPRTGADQGWEELRHGTFKLQSWPFSAAFRDFVLAMLDPDSQTRPTAAQLLSQPILSGAAMSPLRRVIRTKSQMTVAAAAPVPH